MALPIQVSFHHFEPTDLIRERIDAAVNNLEKFRDAITQGRVTVDGVNRHGHKLIVEITVELDLPKGKAIAKRSAEFPSPAGQQTFDRALAEAFKSAALQVRNHLAKMRPHESQTVDSRSMHGRIGKLNHTVGNGFVELSSGDSLFFADDVLEGRFKNLTEGDEVIVTISSVEGPYGPQASAVKPIAPMERVR